MERCFQFSGWMVFLVCSALFITQSVLSRDAVGLAASLTFLLGCLLFVAAFFSKSKR